MNTRLAQHALARHFDYYRQMIVPNVYFAGGEMDVAIVTDAGYLVEVEIKASLSDWNADRAKAKWQSKDRALVSRFYYAIPPELVEKRPNWVPVEHGLLELQWLEHGRRYYVIERAPARRTKTAPKLTDQQVTVLLNSTYHRFWQRELRAVAA